MFFSSAENDFTNLVARAPEGLVVVAVNYRLNIFGFLATKELSEEQGGASGNYGIRDQVLALQWVRDNIAAFNGDPNRVTIAGQSSGGTSVFALLSAPSTRGLYSSAISLSGSPNLSQNMSITETQNIPIVENSPCQSLFANSGYVIAITTCTITLYNVFIFNFPHETNMVLVVIQFAIHFSWLTLPSPCLFSFVSLLPFYQSQFFECHTHVTRSDLLACMRQLNVSVLQSLIPDSWFTTGIFGLPKVSRCAAVLFCTVLYSTLLY